MAEHRLKVRDKGEGVRDVVCTCGMTTVGFTEYTASTFNPDTGEVTEGDYISLDAATELMLEGMKRRHPEATY
jgi:hypothetical protein